MGCVSRVRSLRKSLKTQRIALQATAPSNETQRLAALRALNILDSAPEIAYDEIAQLAAQICCCPIAYISFIDDDRRWLKAMYGLSPATAASSPRSTAMCATTICGTEVLAIEDLLQDPRFERSPMTKADPPCRFYCGLPLITDEGYALGTLCVLDIKPRELSFEQVEALRRLSRQVLTQLELRRRLIEYDQTIKQLDEARLQAAAERTRAEELLDNILPAPVAEELKKNGKVQPKYTQSATILFADFHGFSLLAEQTEPIALIGLLDEYFSEFDEIIGRHGLEKLKTIGDAYMAVGGVPLSDRHHTIDTCLAALEMQTIVMRMKAQREQDDLPALELRIGIHAGPVISGVVGNLRFTFDVWGDAVNKASFMEAHGTPSRINVSETVAGHVKDYFELEPRGFIESKHEWTHRMFFLNRIKPELSSDSEGSLPNERFPVRPVR
jgi:adenylate cyclase